MPTLCNILIQILTSSVVMVYSTVAVAITRVVIALVVTDGRRTPTRAGRLEREGGVEGEGWTVSIFISINLIRHTLITTHEHTNKYIYKKLLQFRI